MKVYCVKCKIELELRTGFLGQLLGKGVLKYEDGYYCMNCAMKDRGFQPR